MWKLRVGEVKSCPRSLGSELGLAPGQRCSRIHTFLAIGVCCLLCSAQECAQWVYSLVHGKVFQIFEVSPWVLHLSSRLMSPVLRVPPKTYFWFAHHLDCSPTSGQPLDCPRPLLPSPVSTTLRPERLPIPHQLRLCAPVLARVTQIPSGRRFHSDPFSVITARDSAHPSGCSYRLGLSSAVSS